MVDEGRPATTGPVALRTRGPSKEFRGFIAVNSVDLVSSRVRSTHWWDPTSSSRNSTVETSPTGVAGTLLAWPSRVAGSLLMASAYGR